MAGHTERFKAFVKLGTFFRTYGDTKEKLATPDAEAKRWRNSFHETLVQAGNQNAWFTRDNILRAIAAWGEQLKADNLRRWLSRYDLEKNQPKTVAIIMAGNIPLVGFHDFLSVLITGNRALVKLSSNDRHILSFVASYLIHNEPTLKDAIAFEEGTLPSYDAVIATGSNNTSRYFDYYFGRKPHIIRRNRNAVAILDGRETREQLLALGADIFTYFGLGCRNVSKLFVPEKYDLSLLFNALEHYAAVGEHQKYANNYDYNKAVYLMSDFHFLDNGFLLLKEDTSYSSPIGTLFYEYYDDIGRINERLYQDREKIQCVLGTKLTGMEHPFGTSQNPALWDYADGVDTVEFLLKT